MTDLQDVDWLFLDILMRSKDKGVHRVNRHELMSTNSIPDAAKLKLTFAGLLMANGPYVNMVGSDFVITDEGQRVFIERWRKPSAVPDLIIALPDLSNSARLQH